MSDESGFEERADQLTDEQIMEGTIVEDHFDGVSRALVGRGLVLIVGPRGCGKTQMMRYAAIRCRDDARLPFAAYVSFNRYLRLEPLLNSRSDAMVIFHAWVLSLILLAVGDALRGMDPKISMRFWKAQVLEQDELKAFVGRTEKGLAPTSSDERTLEALSIDVIKEAVRAAAELADRRRSVILLDDAALTLTPEFLVEFFDIVRVLKASDISLKASVYPGTTEYGPRFHTDHEGRSIPVWLSVDDPGYVEVMSDIADRRFPQASQVPDDVRQALMFVSFGVPRAYLTLLREWVSAGSGNSEQQRLNKLIREHRDARWAEYNSISLKLPKLASMIQAGGRMFAAMIDALRNANVAEDGGTLQLQIAVLSSDFDSMTARMVNLLVEAGLVREEPEVSHGPDRKYRRLSPHLGALIADRALSNGRGGGARRIARTLGMPRSKHAVRRTLVSLFSAAGIQSLHYDLPPCQNCRTERLSANQRFCHSCGKKLLDGSTFSRCMEVPVEEVPGLSAFTLESLRRRKLLTVGSIVSLQDPGTELRKSRGVGETRSSRTIARVEAFVDEFLS